jgi:hypothetical protein
VARRRTRRGRTAKGALPGSMTLEAKPVSIAITAAATCG